jgi:hypothetical protein
MGVSCSLFVRRMLHDENRFPDEVQPCRLFRID